MVRNTASLIARLTALATQDIICRVDLDDMLGLLALAGYRIDVDPTEAGRQYTCPSDFILTMIAAAKPAEAM